MSNAPNTAPGRVFDRALDLSGVALTLDVGMTGLHHDGTVWSSPTGLLVLGLMVPVGLVVGRLSARATEAMGRRSAERILEKRQRLYPGLRNDSAESLYRRARHEAAHAVMVLLLGWEVRYVNIDLVLENGRVQGGVTSWFGPEDTPTEQAAWGRMCVALAPMVHEHDTVGHLSDSEDAGRAARTLVCALGGRPTEANLLRELNRAAVHARRCLDRHGDAVEALARELVRRDDHMMSGEDISRLLADFGLSHDDTKE